MFWKNKDLVDFARVYLALVSNANTDFWRSKKWDVLIYRWKNTFPYDLLCVVILITYLCTAWLYLEQPFIVSGFLKKCIWNTSNKAEWCWRLFQSLLYFLKCSFIWYKKRWVSFIHPDSSLSKDAQIYIYPAASSIQFILGDFNAFPSQPRDIISLVCLGSSPGSPTGGTWNTLYRWCLGGILVKCSNHINRLLLM